MRRAPCLLLLGVLVAWGSRPAPLAAAGDADPDDAAKVALGHRVYDSNCASCHGLHLEGQADWQTRKANGKLPAPPHDWHGHTWRHPDSQLFAFVKNGVAPYSPAGYKTDMLAFGGTLSDAEIWAVITYIKSAWPPEFRRYQRAITQRVDGK
jgi:mono/diheme cytochrome c family protein